MKDQSLSAYLRLMLTPLRAFAHAVLPAEKVLFQLSHLSNLHLNITLLESFSLTTQGKISLLPSFTVS